MLPAEDYWPNLFFCSSYLVFMDPIKTGLGLFQCVISKKSIYGLFYYAASGRASLPRNFLDYILITERFGALKRTFFQSWKNLEIKNKMTWSKSVLYWLDWVFSRALLSSSSLVWNSSLRLRQWYIFLLFSNMRERGIRSWLQLTSF